MIAPPELPAHLRPLAIPIPRTWTPEQALAVFEFIEDLRNAICAIYNVQLQDLLREQCAASREDDGEQTADHRSI
jgi:hypothetical protein